MFKQNVSYEIVRPFVRQIKSIIGLIIETPDDDSFVLKRGKAQVGKIHYNYETSELVVEGDEFISILKEIIEREKSLSEFFTDENMKKTPFVDILKEQNYYGGITRNIPVFQQITDGFKELKIGKVHMFKDIDKRNEILKTLTLFINPKIIVDRISNNGYPSRTKKVIFKSFPHTLADENKFDCIVGDGYGIRPVGEEVIEPIILYDYEVGRYYRNRNVLILFFNPFGLNNVDVMTTDMPEIFKVLFAKLTDMKIKKENADNIIRQNFITNFMSSAKDKLSVKENHLNNLASDIKSYENHLVQRYRDKALALSNIEHLKNLISTNGKDMLKDLDKLDKLPFLEEYKLNNDSLELTYKPTFLTIKDFKRNISGTNYGIRKVYVGSITFTISPSDIIVKSSNPMMNGNPHTHGSSDGNPCFGDGDAAAKIRSFRTENKFAELASMLWFWIQTHREGGAYIKAKQFYDDRLQQGLPILDEKGKLIEINEKERISSGEQLQLSPMDNYEENKKRIKEYMEANK